MCRRSHRMEHTTVGSGSGAMVEECEMRAPGVGTGVSGLERWMDLVGAAGLDGWLVADFRWSSPVFGRLLGLTGGILTRRCFLWLPAAGRDGPRVLASRVDGHTLTALDCPVSLYRGFDDMQAELRRLLPHRGRVAMEYSPEGTLPTISRVDAGLVEMIRGLGVEVVSSGTLVAALETWDERRRALHRQAAAAVDAARAEALRSCFDRVRTRREVTEGELAAVIQRVFMDRGMAAGDGPDVAVNAHAADPHYRATGGPGGAIGPDAVLLIDLWCRVRDADEAPFADSTWMAYTGATVPAEYQAVFDATAGARDAALDRLSQGTREGRSISGAEVDRVARQVVEQAGLGQYLVHRTGHSLGTDHVHGMGTNLDAIEFPDDRPVLPHTGFTVEPGLYLPGRFGVRLEVSAMLMPDGPEITTERQTRITTPA